MKVFKHVLIGLLVMFLIAPALNLTPCAAENTPEGKSPQVNEKSSKMVYNETMKEPGRQKAVDSRPFDHETPHGPKQSGHLGTTTAPSAAIPGADNLVNTYYIYSYDGKLLCEYDHNGNCVKDYIYIGNRLLAEYHPQTNKYYYYTIDQVNSTRVITDDNGNVVYSAAHGPYGQVQKTWTNTYDPRLKFSGKEREGYSHLDYFGARYYNHQTYRFNSVDPLINKKRALTNPQAWNLYAFCQNNPITNFDPDGRDYDNMWLFGAERARIYRKYGDKAGAEYDEFMAKSWAEALFIAVAIVVPFIESESSHSKPQKEKSVDDLIGSKPGGKTHGRSRIYQTKGGFEQANKDFDALNPSNVRDYPGGKRVGELKDGRTVILRPGSKDGRPTLEIQKGKNKTKFRYDE